MFFVHFDDEHVFLILLPVTGSFPQFAVNDLRCVHLDIAASALGAAHVILKCGVDGPAVRVPEHLTGGLFLHVEQVHFAAQFTVVAFGGLFQHQKVGFEVVAVLEGDAVDTLKHLAVAVAAPVGAGHGHQFERITGHLTCVLQVRAAAQILPVAVPVHADRLTIIGDRVDQFDLIVFTVLFVIRDGIGTRPDLGPDFVAGVDDVFHLLFNRAEVFGCEGLFAVKVIVPAVVDNGADGDFDVGPDFLHRAGHDVRQIVADQFKRLGRVLHGVDRDVRVGVDRPLQIPVLAVDGGRDRFFGQGFGNGGRDFGRGDACVEFTCVAIGESQGNLGHWPCSSSVWRPQNARLRVNV